MGLPSAPASERLPKPVSETSFEAASDPLTEATSASTKRPLRSSLIERLEESDFVNSMSFTSDIV